MKLTLDKKEVIIRIRISNDMYARLQSKCVQSGKSLSELVRNIIDEWLKKNKS